MSDAELIETIGAIYDAALDAGRWEEALAQVSRFTGAEAGILGLSDACADTAQVFVTHNVDAGVIARWTSEFACEDPWAGASAQIEEGEVVTGASLVPLEELRRRRVYREIHVPAGGHDVLAAIVAKSRLRAGWVNVYPGVGRDFFGPDNVDRMVPLVPHLQRSAKLHERFAQLERQARASAAALDALSAAVIACDERGRVLHANRAAETLLREGTALGLRQGRLRPPGANEARRLEALIEGAAATSRRQSARGGGVVALPRRHGGRPLTAMVAPVSPEAGATLLPDDEGTAAVVVISDPDRPIDVPEGVLAELFGLTRKESGVALAVARGESLEGYADRTGTEVGTARWHMKHVLGKTGTARQAELVSMLLLSLGAFL